MCAVVVLVAAFPVLAAEISTGGVRIFNGEIVSCVASNVGTTVIKDIQVRVEYLDINGHINYTGNRPCTNVAPSSVCSLDDVGFPADHSIFCVIKSSGSKVRGTLCNVTRGMCADAR
jgi:hypothetical protein